MWRCFSHQRLAAFFVALASAAGCGGVDESKFSEVPGTVPDGAAVSPADYDAKNPVPNAGDAPKGKAGNVTNP